MSHSTGCVAVMEVIRRLVKQGVPPERLSALFFAPYLRIKGRANRAKLGAAASATFGIPLVGLSVAGALLATGEQKTSVLRRVGRAALVAGSAGIWHLISKALLRRQRIQRDRPPEVAEYHVSTAHNVHGLSTLWLMTSLARRAHRLINFNGVRIAVICGDNDDTVETGTTESWARTVGAQFLTVPGGDHLIVRHPAALAAAMEFLGQQFLPSPPPQLQPDAVLAAA